MDHLHLADQHERDNPAGRDTPIPDDARTRSRPTPARILIVDDDEGTVDAYARTLRLDGYDIRTAPNAEEGFRELESYAPHVVLVDLRMPLVDGLGFLRRLRAYREHRKTPVAIVTGDYFLDDNIRRQLEKAGARIHFKPLWLDDLINLVEGLLKSIE